MGHVIIDTNVPLKAADLCPIDEIDRKCSAACLQFISQLIHSSDTIVLDAGGEILNEYRRNINMAASDNAATVYLKWVLRKQLLGNADLINITKIGNNSYKEFPASPGLKNFDPSDRKFVALAKAHPHHPPIINGSDTDWWISREALQSEGVQVVFLCEEYMKERSKGKKKEK